MTGFKELARIVVGLDGGSAVPVLGVALRPGVLVVMSISGSSTATFAAMHRYALLRRRIKSFASLTLL